ncbi:helix-turn-helix transcriptional regulator [Tautonia plasticadhaerens]|uniref:HTH domain protein n=1 Tax=Tautonia plasticadhaerens TaxID=2527974 RepID=A0A518H9U0_9BACT|nr:WYL domain-containing transcriptional regulator [Tautonia plasticadhaerens]QDV37567.1 hypothetical protein ElP_55070 [Tautonia plasticadhaerens]
MGKNRTKPGMMPQGNAARRPEPERRLRQADRFARILKLLELLQGYPRCNRPFLARELEITVRTVQRDLEVLRLAGVPWDFDRAEGCYLLPDGWQFPGTGLTGFEALGRVTSAALAGAMGLPDGKARQTHVRRPENPSRRPARELLEDTRRVTAVLGMKLADHGQCGPAIRTIQEALLGGRCLEGTYASPYQSGEKRLVLHPYRLCFVKQAWYLIARPEGSDRPTTYRVARFRAISGTGAPASVPEVFDLRAYFGDAWAVYRGERGYEVEVRFVPEAAALVTETNWHHTQRERRHEDGSLTLEFRVDGLEEIVWWVLGWTGRVEVVQPPELRAMVVERLRSALAMNGIGLPRS